MSLIHRLTQTHADLDIELAKFGRLLAEFRDAHKHTPALQDLQQEFDAVRLRVERHIAVETSLEERSDVVLGAGSMTDYAVPEHQSRLRRAVDTLRITLKTEGANDALHRQFESVLEHFERYTTAELEFLQANAAILSPGGSNS